MVRIIVENSIRKEIEKNSRGKIYFVDDFFDFGTPDSVNKALQRLDKKGFLIRIATGIYLYPSVDEEIGIIFPAVEEIAIAVAKRDRARIFPSGSYAVNKIGLSTQVPVNAVFLTDGAARIIKIGRRNIKFKKTSPKNLLLKGSVSGLIIQALKEIGRNNVNAEHLKRISDLLKKESSENIRHDAKLAPVWIREILMESLKNGKTEKLDQNSGKEKN
jgi:hypothetical protein